MHGPNPSLHVVSKGWRVAAFALLSGAVCPPDAYANCPTPDSGETATVERVFDGDTFALKDGRRVRMIGLDAPETGKKGKPAELLAQAAKQALVKLIPPGASVTLVYDQTRYDRYRRTLAFVFGPKREDAQLTLLTQGLATALVIPPRRQAIRCYAQAEQAAREAQRGLWAHARYQPVETAALGPRSRGFRVIRGSVQRITRSKSATWLNLGNNIALRIPHTDLRHFPDKPQNLWSPGDRIEARGTIYQRKGQLRLSVHHPWALKVLTSSR